MQVQKTPEEIPSLHLRLILIPGTETPLNNKKKKKTLGKRKHLFPDLPHYKIQTFIFQQNPKGI